MQVEHGHVARHGDIPLGDRREHVALPAPVIPDQPVTAALVELQRAVVHERVPTDRERKVDKLEIARGLSRGEDAGDGARRRHALLLRRERCLALAPQCERRKREARLCGGTICCDKGDDEVL